jgi:hypothetical protein
MRRRTKSKKNKRSKELELKLFMIKEKKADKHRACSGVPVFPFSFF